MKNDWGERIILLYYGFLCQRSRSGERLLEISPRRIASVEKHTYSSESVRRWRQHRESRFGISGLYIEALRAPDNSDNSTAIKTAIYYPVIQHFRLEYSVNSE